MVSFVIPGKPFAKQRHNFSRATGRAFTPKATVSFESTVRDIALPKFPRPLEGPVSIRIEATFVPAPSWPKKRRLACLGQPHTQKPDLDNVEKSILDGLNRIAFADDLQVARVVKEKRWGPVAQTVVVVEPLGPLPSWQAAEAVA